jgi:cold shock CspA family protein
MMPRDRDDREHGDIVRWLPQIGSGYGFIRPDRGDSDDLFLPASSLPPGDPDRTLVGRRVSFDRVRDLKGGADRAHRIEFEEVDLK